MEDGTEGFDDWEILPTESAAAETEVEAEGLIMLRLDHFSINNENVEYCDERSELSSDAGGSVVSDKPSWIDPAAFPRRNSGEFWPDFSSDRSKFSHSEEKLGLGFGETDHSLVFEMDNELSYLGKLGFDAAGSSVGEESEDVRVVENMTVHAENSVEKLEMAENPVGEEMESSVEVEAAEDGETVKEVEQPVNAEKKALLWWKLPLELVKFCVFRISPVWSISVAAAMLGVFIVRGRLHMMKKKTKGLRTKVTMDDKKVDQFMSRAARLNEAFSVVRRVPIIRPSLPAPGVTPWPVVSMR